MELTILGSGTAVPSTGRSPSSLVVEVDGEPILFDSGPGTLQRLARADIDCRKLNRIFYTHFHPDHIADLASLLFLYRNPDSLRDEKLTVTGPTGFKDFHSRLQAVYGRWIAAENYELEIAEALNDEIITERYVVRSREVLHSDCSVGYRVEDRNGRSLGYLGDTAYCKGIVELGVGADLLVLECSFPDHEEPRDHLTPRTSGRIAEETGCPILVLTHFYPQCEGVGIVAQTKKVFSGEVILARDLMRIQING